MKERLKKISGKEFSVLLIGIYFLSGVLTNMSGDLKSTIIISIISTALILYVTYHRWMVLKFNNILFVFFLIVNLFVLFYGYDITIPDYTRSEEFLEFSRIKRILTNFTFLFKILFIFPFNLVLIFMDAKPKKAK